MSSKKLPPKDQKKKKPKKKKKPRKLVLENTIGRVLVDQLLMQPDFLWQNTGNKCLASMLLTNQYCSNSPSLPSDLPWEKSLLYLKTH